MDEDLEVNRFVKGSLEAGKPFVWKFPHGQSRRWPWAAASLLAASVLLIAMFFPRGRVRSSSVEETLLLLSEIEGVELGAGEAVSTIDLLVAWQGEAAFT